MTNAGINMSIWIPFTKETIDKKTPMRIRMIQILEILHLYVKKFFMKYFDYHKNSSYFCSKSACIFFAEENSSLTDILWYKNGMTKALQSSGIT